MSNKNEKLYIEINKDIIGKLTNITDIEKQCIIHYLSNLTATPIRPYYIEIGVFYGGTFRLILDTFRENILAIGIDLFEDFDVTKQNTHDKVVTKKHILEEVLTELGHKNFILLKGDSNKLINTLPPIPLACCFIDGNHSFDATLKDFLSLYNKVECGFFLFHDSHYWGVPDVINIVKTYPRAKQIGKQDSITVFQICPK